ncbi:conserved hypothetical protein [Magnetospirillum sp. SS-4]|nr:conserved hypothetical protein [Magnetospirillum sp. SS-4]
MRAGLHERWPDLLLNLLGKPVSRMGGEWRWNRRGSLSAVVAGQRAGQWFDHEAGTGGGPVELIQRERGDDWQAAADWARRWLGLERTAPSPPRRKDPEPAADDARHSRARIAARTLWDMAAPVAADHPYLRRKGVAPHDLRQDSAGRLVIPLIDLDETIHTIQWIDGDGTKRFLKGGAKAGHFARIGPPLGTAPRVVICEGWVTGASIHDATGLPIVAAMDAGNLRPVATRIRQRYPALDIIVAADNDLKPDRDANPGLAAATHAAEAVGGRLAVPPLPGDFNDLALGLGADEVRHRIAAATAPSTPAPAYPAPTLSVAEARAALEERINVFMAEVVTCWQGVGIDLNPPPQLALPVDVGLGKTSVARRAITSVLVDGLPGGGKIVIALPRHDLGCEQVAAFAALGVAAMVWRGRTAPDPTPDDPERLMCLDPAAQFDALEVEQPVEQAVCKLKRKGTLHICPHYHVCGYQRQKAEAQAASVILCAHDSLFHQKPAAIGTARLLVIDEAFWQAGLRGIDGRAVLSLDGLSPAGVLCYDVLNRPDWDVTADLVEARRKLHCMLTTHDKGMITVAALRASGLSAKTCRIASGLERRRLRNPGLLPGMNAGQRMDRIHKVLPPADEPWAPPGRAAALWTLLADALDGDHDAAGVTLFDDQTKSGSVRSLRLAWRAPLREGWADGVPVLHLDATLSEELVRPYLPDMVFAPPVLARQPHVIVRQVLDAPTSAKALCPPEAARDRDRAAAETHRRDIAAIIALRAAALRGRGRDGPDLLVIGQKDTLDHLRTSGLPANVDVVHFNALSGLDRWGGVAGMLILGRTLPSPAAVEHLARAMTNRPVEAAGGRSWWYGESKRAIRLADGGTQILPGDHHADPLAEAIRWSICEAELIQAIGRGRGVNRTSETPLEVDLLTDVVLPVTIDTVLSWDEARPGRTDIMATHGVMLDNAADRARCFPDLWPTPEAAKQDRWRRVTNCYYRNISNSEMLRSSVTATYQPAGAGQKPRRAMFDLDMIKDPKAWLEQRLGPLVRWDVEE